MSPGHSLPTGRFHTHQVAVLFYLYLSPFLPPLLFNSSSLTPYYFISTLFLKDKALEVIATIPQSQIKIHKPVKK